MAASVILSLSLALAGGAAPANHTGRHSGQSRYRPAELWLWAAARCDYAWMDYLAPGVLIVFGGKADKAAKLCGDSRLRLPVGWTHERYTSMACAAIWRFCLIFHLSDTGVIYVIRAIPLPEDGAGPGPLS